MTPLEGSKGELSFSSPQTIAIPSGETAKLMAIRKSDWQRLKHRIQQAAHPMPRLSIAYSIFFGVTITAVFSLIPIGLTPGAPQWVLPAYVLVCVFSFAIGCILAMLDQKLKKHGNATAADVIEDMNAVEKTLGEL